MPTHSSPLIQSGSGPPARIALGVSLAVAWMNLLAPIAKPFFRWNHDVIMRWGEGGLRMRLG